MLFPSFLCRYRSCCTCCFSVTACCAAELLTVTASCAAELAPVESACTACLLSVAVHLTEVAETACNCICNIFICIDYRTAGAAELYIAHIEAALLSAEVHAASLLTVALLLSAHVPVAHVEAALLLSVLSLSRLLLSLSRVAPVAHAGEGHASAALVVDLAQYIDTLVVVEEVIGICNQ